MFMRRYALDIKMFNILCSHEIILGTREGIKYFEINRSFRIAHAGSPKITISIALSSPRSCEFKSPCYFYTHRKKMYGNKGRKQRSDFSAVSRSIYIVFFFLLFIRLFQDCAIFRMLTERTSHSSQRSPTLL